MQVMQSVRRRLPLYGVLIVFLLAFPSVAGRALLKVAGELNYFGLRLATSPMIELARIVSRDRLPNFTALAGNVAERGGAYAKAVEYYERELASAEDPIWTLLRLAVTHTKLGDLDAAVATYMKAHDLDAKEAARYARGWVSKETFGLSRFQSSEGNIEPHPIAAFYRLAEQSAANGNVQSAASVVEQAARFDRVEARWHFVARLGAHNATIAKSARNLATEVAANSSDRSALLLAAWMSTVDLRRQNHLASFQANSRDEWQPRDIEALFNELKSATKLTDTAIHARFKAALDYINIPTPLVSPDELNAVSEQLTASVSTILENKRLIEKCWAEHSAAHAKEQKRWSWPWSSSKEQFSNTAHDGCFGDPCRRVDQKPHQSVAAIMRPLNEHVERVQRTSLASPIKTAKSAYDELVASDPSDVHSYRERAEWLEQHYYRTRDRSFAEAAFADYDVAAEHDLLDARSHASRADMRFELGDFERAADDLEHYLTRDPNALEQRIKLIKSYAKLGRDGELAIQLVKLEMLQPGIIKQWGLDRLLPK